MAEIVFRKMAHTRGIEAESVSFATSDEETGAPIYGKAREALARRGYYGEHTAVQITASDIDACDYVLCMDGYNLRDLGRISPKSGKIRRLCDFTARPRDVADPYFTRDFEKALDDIEDGCAAFLDFLEKGERKK